MEKETPPQNHVTANGEIISLQAARVALVWGDESLQVECNCSGYVLCRSARESGVCLLDHSLFQPPKSKWERRYCEAIASAALCNRFLRGNKSGEARFSSMDA